MKKYRTHNYDNRGETSMPEPDGHPTYHRPRRNYWGNLLEEDTYKEEAVQRHDYDYSDYDPEDDHSAYYDNNSYD